LKKEKEVMVMVVAFSLLDDEIKDFTISWEEGNHRIRDNFYWRNK